MSLFVMRDEVVAKDGRRLVRERPNWFSFATTAIVLIAIAVAGLYFIALPRLGSVINSAGGQNITTPSEPGSGQPGPGGSAPAVLPTSSATTAPAPTDSDQAAPTATEDEYPYGGVVETAEGPIDLRWDYVADVSNGILTYEAKINLTNMTGETIKITLDIYPQDARGQWLMHKIAESEAILPEESWKVENSDTFSGAGFEKALLPIGVDVKIGEVTSVP